MWHRKNCEIKRNSLYAHCDLNYYSPKESSAEDDDEVDDEEDKLLLLLLLLVLIRGLDFESLPPPIRLPLTKFSADKQLLRMPSFRLLRTKLLLCGAAVPVTFTLTCTSSVQLHFSLFLLFFCGFTLPLDSLDTVFSVVAAIFVRFCLRLLLSVKFEFESLLLLLRLNSELSQIDTFSSTETLLLLLLLFTLSMDSSAATGVAWTDGDATPAASIVFKVGRSYGQVHFFKTDDGSMVFRVVVLLHV